MVGATTLVNDVFIKKRKKRHFLFIFANVLNVKSSYFKYLFTHLPPPVKKESFMFVSNATSLNVLEIHTIYNTNSFFDYI